MRVTQAAAVRVALVGSLALGASACATVKVPKVDALSIAQSESGREVIASARRAGPYPRFNDIPRVPTDVRPAAAWAVAANDTQAALAVLARQVAALPPAPTDTEAFAAALQARIAVPAEPVAPDAAAQTAAYARALRARATPPPPRH
jgi:hypothetical protein